MFIYIIGGKRNSNHSKMYVTNPKIFKSISYRESYINNN